MSTTSSIGIDDNLSARQTCVAMRTTNHELTRRIDMISNITLEQTTNLLVAYFCNHPWNQDVDDILSDALQHLLVCFLFCESVLHRRHNELVVLSAYHNGMYALWLAIITIFNRHLTLGVRTQISHLLAVRTDIGHHLPLPADVSQHPQNAMREVERQRDTILRFVRSITKHHTLVASTLLLRVLTFHTTVDVTALFVDGIQHTTTFAVKLVRRLRVTNPVDGFTCNLLKIHIDIALHLASQHHLTRRDQCLASHLRVGVVSQQIVQHSVADLVSHFVGMSLRY